MKFFLKFIMVFLIISPINALGGTPVSGDLMDYLIEDVCIDSNNQPIAGDPATCSAHRNIALGERIPYIVTDVDKNNNNVTYMAWSSYPVMGMDGTLKIMHFKSGQGNFSSNYQFSFLASRDGYDLTDVDNSGYASFVRTSDGGCYDQIWSHNGSANNMGDRAGGWILFPNGSSPSTWPSSSSSILTTYHVQVTPGLSNCSNGHSQGVTYWNSPASYNFETGKYLTAIRSDHFASSSLSSSNNALERYYFTKEYGLTRWEAWLPLSRCQSENGTNAPICHPENPSTYPLQGRCSVLNVSSSGNAGIDYWGNQTWVRTDCRDETNYIALSTPQASMDGTIAQMNGYVDIDSSATLSPSLLGYWLGNSAQSYHSSGSANGSGWQITANGSYSNLSYGPYVYNMPAGHLNAAFDLMIDNNSADNSNLIYIDVYRNTDGTLFASKVISRQQFNYPNQVQRFYVPFDYDGAGELEFRVNVYGSSYVYHAGSGLIR